MAIDKANLPATTPPAALAAQPGPRRFRLPEKVEGEVDPERIVPFDECVDRDYIVVIGALGEAFDAGLGLAVRVMWLPATEYELVGPDRDQANVSLVPASSIPARVAQECQERIAQVGPEKACRMGRVQKRLSKKRPGQTYYVLVG